jgi:hypothetical protein
MTPFEHWWCHEGSGPPLPGEDAEEHCMRMCKIAWEKSAQAERERIKAANAPEIEKVNAHIAALAKRKQMGYAGITIWGGDAAFTKVFTETEMKHARQPDELIKHSVQVGLDMLAAMADGSKT